MYQRLQYFSSRRVFYQQQLRSMNRTSLIVSDEVRLPDEQAFRTFINQFIFPLSRCKLQRIVTTARQDTVNQKQSIQLCLQSYLYCCNDWCLILGRTCFNVCSSHIFIDSVISSYNYIIPSRSYYPVLGTNFLRVLCNCCETNANQLPVIEEPCLIGKPNIDALACLPPLLQLRLADRWYHNFIALAQP